VHANQVAQCTIPLELRCLVPRNKRMNMYLAGIWTPVSKEIFEVHQRKLTWVMSMAVTISPGRANP
jgi:hypothetical protein